MGLASLPEVVTELIKFWEKQNILLNHKSKLEIEQIQKNKFLNLPYDFIEFYTRVNGMDTMYPNEIDKEGFLFYPIEAVIPITNEFENCNLKNKEKIFLFAEYMHKSWWYGFELINDKEYMIGIIPHKDFFKPITNSLTNFINLYIEDSEKLYDYS